MTDKLIDLNTKVAQLNQLLETANTQKILWEEVKIVSDKAFTLQDEIIASLDKLEATEKDLIKLQSVFDAREIVWDLMAKIATRELEVKEKTTKNHKNAHEKTTQNHGCDCGHTHKKHACECGNECDCEDDEHDHACECGNKTSCHGDKK